MGVILRMAGRVARVAAVLIVVLVAVVVTIGLWLSASLPAWNGAQIADGIAAPVEIVRDNVGATHIYAANDDDAYFALGYAHAQDRLWQMDIYRRIGAGRVAEIVGRPGLVADRFTRTLGLYRSAERQYEALPAPVRGAVDAYADGVNAYIAGHEGPWPPEFTLLAYRPERWRPADSLVLGKLLALMLGGNWFDELRRAALLDRLTPDEVEFLLPTDLDDAPVTLAQGTRLPVDAARLLAATPALLQPRRASNAWAVDGTHTGSGKPILASDPHLGLTAPGIWYLARIEAPGLRMTGATVPGMPVHLLGHNGHIAWGLTTTYGDLTDLLVLDIAGPDAYRVGDTTAAFAVREERIAVRLGEDVTLRVRETPFGPVISDVIDSAATHAGETAVVVLRASALDDADLTPAAMFDLNRARDWAGFRDALRRYGVPQQNIVYADADGTIGFFAPGLVPVRRDGRGLVPGRLPDNDWTGYIPFDDLPQRRGDPRGIIFNANNRIVGDDYPYFISADWEPPFRAERLAEVLLGDDAPATVDGHVALQGDTLSPMARLLLPAMLARLPTADRSAAAIRAVALLAAWDYRMDADKTAPTVFAAWYARLDDLVFGDDLGEQRGRVDPRRLHQVLRDDRGSWCDDRSSAVGETCSEMTGRALDEALAALGEQHGEDARTWRWGAAHPARFVHPALSFLPGVPRWLGITVESGGGNYTLRRGGYGGGGDGQFVNGHGAGYRAVYDLGDLDRSVFMVAPGTSGNPYSRFFAEHTTDWRNATLVRLPANRAAAQKDARGVFTLIPVE